MTNSIDFEKNKGVIVVNCFQISNFVLWQTATALSRIDNTLLWIAFKLVTLSYDKQLERIAAALQVVVNCFQISNFVLWQTALVKYVCVAQCCELLSN